jgi:membrane-associated phospholipid phosphatase
MIVPAVSVAIALVFSSAPEIPENQTARKSVYRLYPAVDVAVITVSMLAIVVPYSFSSSFISPRCPCNPSEVNALDRHVIGNHSAAAATISDLSVGLAWVAPVALDLIDVGWGRAWFEDMVVYAEALLVSGALVTVAKHTVQRPLPVVYAGQAPELINRPGGYRSFYSGHATNAVTALTVGAMTYTARHGPAWWPWVATAAFGISVGAERVFAGRHFYSDVAVGAFAGALVGWAIPKLHQTTGSSVTLLPAPGGVQFAITRTF